MSVLTSDHMYVLTYVKITITYLPLFMQNMLIMSVHVYVCMYVYVHETHDLPPPLHAKHAHKLSQIRPIRQCKHIPQVCPGELHHVRRQPLESVVYSSRPKKPASTLQMDCGFLGALHVA